MCYRSGRLGPSTSGSREQQSDFKFDCKLWCCKCSYCHRVATKERRKSQCMSNVHRNKICERCFLCWSLVFCKSCCQCPTCCYRSSCRGKVTPVLGEMGSPGFKSKSSHHTEGWLHSPLPVQTQLDKVTDCNNQLPQSSQTVLPFRSTVSADKQKCSRTGRKSKLTGFLQPAIFGTQAQQPLETGPGPEHLEHLLKHRVVQDGDPKDNKNLPTGRGVGHIHRFQRHILPHTNPQSVQEVHAFSPPGSVLPVQSPTLWSIHSSHGVHSGGQRGQTHGTSEGYKDPPVPRRLAGESLYPQHLSPAYSNPGHTLSGTRVAGEQGEVRAGSQTCLQLCRLLVRPEGGQGQTNRRTLANFDRQNQINTVGSGLPGPTIHVPHRSTHSNRKTSPLRATTHETHTVALEKQLEGPRVTGKGDSGPQVPPPPSKVVAGGKQCAARSTITPSKTCSADFYRRIKRRVGRSLRRAHCKGNLVPSREQAAHKPLRAKSSVSSSKRVSNPLLQQDSTDSYRQHNSGCLYQQRGGDEIGLPVCPTVENPVLVYQTTGNPQGTSHPRPAERDSRQAIQTWPDNSNRVVTSSSSVPSYMLPVAPAPSGPVCHQVQQQTTTICLSGPRPPGMGSGCTQPLLGGPGPIRLPTSSHLGQSGGEATGLPLQQNNSDCPGVSKHALVLESSDNVQSNPTVSAQHTQLSVSAIQPGPSQEPVKSEPACLAPRASAIKEQGFSEAVAAQIEAPQRGSTRSVYEAKWTIFTKWCLSNQVDFRAPPLKAIADFLLHLFQNKKLQPGTIDSYRSAIADKLGNSTINVSKDENLTRLLDSFHRDRPKGRRGIPSWNLSLVLHQLTKAPFEPLKEASLKHLTFKTVFVLALGSGKRRSEIHAWLHKNIRHQSDWSKVTCIPHPASYPRISWLRRVQTVWHQWSSQHWHHLWIGHSRVTGPYVQLEPYATTWTGL